MMQPLKPEEKERILANRPEMAPRELDSLVEEYEELLASRYHRDPDAPLAPAAAEAMNARAERLQELNEILFAEEEADAQEGNEVDAGA